MNVTFHSIARTFFLHSIEILLRCNRERRRRTRLLIKQINRDELHCNTMILILLIDETKNNFLFKINQRRTRMYVYVSINRQR